MSRAAGALPWGLVGLGADVIEVCLDALKDLLGFAGAEFGFEPFGRGAVVLLVIAAVQPSTERDHIRHNGARAAWIRKRYPVISMCSVQQTIEWATASGAAVLEVINAPLPLNNGKSVWQGPLASASARRKKSDGFLVFATPLFCRACKVRVAAPLLSEPLPIGVVISPLSGLYCLLVFFSVFCPGGLHAFPTGRAQSILAAFVALKVIHCRRKLLGASPTYFEPLIRFPCGQWKARASRAALLAPGIPWVFLPFVSTVKVIGVSWQPALALSALLERFVHISPIKENVHSVAMGKALWNAFCQLDDQSSLAHQ